MIDSLSSRLRKWARSVTRDTMAIYLALSDRRTPWYAKVAATIVVAYALSPIDLISDFIPVLGYLDDLVILPLGIWLTVRLIPTPVMESCRECSEAIADRPTSWIAAAVIVGAWLTTTALLGWFAYTVFSGTP